MKVLFKRSILIPFHMADPAGIMFFGNIFALTHATFEEWVSEHAGGWNKWYANPHWIAPIRRAEVDYLLPLRAGETFDVVCSLKETTTSSFVISTEFQKDGKVHVHLETRQVFCDRKTLTKIPIPNEAKKAFQDNSSK